MTDTLLAAGGPLDHVVQWVYVDSGESVWSPIILSNQIAAQIIATILLLIIIDHRTRPLAISVAVTAIHSIR